MTVTRSLTPPVVIGGMLILLLTTSAAVPGGSVAQYTLVSVLAALIGALLVIVIHESGHALAGKLVGFTFARWVAGPLQVEARPQVGGHFRLNHNWRLPGLAVSVPPGNASMLRLRQMIFMAGGPLANLITGICAMNLQDQMGGPVQSWVFESGERGLAELAAVHFLYFFGGLSWLFFLVNLWPTKVDAHQTDGSWLVALIRDGERTSRELAQRSRELSARVDGPRITR